MRGAKSREKKLETYMKFEKKKVELQVQQQLFEKASEITDALIKRALVGDVNAINSAMDRMFGKSKQTMDIDTGGAPIVFMPAVLVEKFQLAEPEPVPVKAEIIDANTTERSIQIPSGTRTNRKRQAPISSS